MHLALRAIGLLAAVGGSGGGCMVTPSRRVTLLIIVRGGGARLRARLDWHISNEIIGVRPAG